MKPFLSIISILALGFLLPACQKTNVANPGNPNTNQDTASQVTVSTFAGNINAGYTNGTASAASFYHPFGLAADASGNLYIGDEGNNCIRKINAAGTVTTLAGAGPNTRGLYNGQGPLAEFFNPDAIVLDAQGNLLVADAQNNSIRKVTASGVVSIVAGGRNTANAGWLLQMNVPGYAGYTDGSAENALFSAPTGITVDAQGNAYVAEYGNNTIRKVDPSGNTTTLAGQGPPAGAGFANGNGTAALFNSPNGIAIDNQGNLFVSDFSNNCIRKITPAGLVSTFAGSGNADYKDGIGTSAAFNEPDGLAFDSKGNLYVADLGNELIRKISPNGTVSTVAGVPQTGGYVDGAASQAQFSWPAGLAFDATGNLYVADYQNNVIRKISFQ